MDTTKAVVERMMMKKLLSILDNPDPPTTGQVAELLFKQTDSATLPQGQIEEIFPAQCQTLSNSVQQHFSTSCD